MIRGSRGRLAISFAATAVALFLVTSSLALSQAVNVCDANVTETGGVPAPLDTVGDPGCLADPSPGCDFSVSDNLIRTHDIVTYVHSYQTSGTVTDVYVELELQLGMVWDVVPGYCQNQPTGSFISGDGVATPSVIRCELGNATNKAEDLPFSARALGSVPNQTTSGLTSAITGGSNVDPPCEDATIPDDITITSAPFYDVIKRNPVDLGASSRNGELGLGFRYPIHILLDNPITGKGKVGNENLDGTPVTLIDDLSQHVPGAELIGCLARNARSSYPNEVINGTNGSDSAVINSGTAVCTQPGGAGTPIEMEITGWDASGDTTPVLGSNQSTALASSDYWVYVSYIDVWIPAQAVTDAGGSFAVTNRIDFDPTDPPTSVSGQDNTESDDANNEYDHTIVVNKGQYAKYSERKPPAAYGSRSLAALPTRSGTKSGDALLAPNQPFGAMVVFNNVGALPFTNFSFCDKFDNTTQELVEFASNPGEAAYLANVGTGPDPAGIIEYAYIDFGDPGGAAATAGGTAAGWSGQLNADCGQTVFGAGEIAWQTSVTANGHSAADFNVVRWTSTEPNGEVWAGDKIRLMLNMKASGDPTLPVGTRIVNSSARRAAEYNGGEWQIWEDYDPITHTTDLGGNDRNTLTKSIVRVTKETVPGDAINSIAAGNPVTYQLNPSVTTPADPPGLANNVVMQDTLPFDVTYVANSATQGGAALPPTVTTLPDGRQLLEWDFGSVVPGVPITPVQFTVLSEYGLPTGTILLNSVVISSDEDGSDLEQRQDTRTVVISNPVGLNIIKQVHTPLIEPNMDIDYTVCFANLSTTTDYTATDMIDVFPFLGDGRIPPSAFSGSVSFVSAASVGAAPATILYTSAAPATIDVDPKTNQPADSSNPASPWCTLAEINGGTAGCPSIGLADVTAIRVDAGPMEKGGPPACVDLTLATANNFEGDIYTNRATVAAPEVANSVTSPDVMTEVVTGEIGDFVWKDYNGDGVQDPNEPGIGGVLVNLYDGSGMVVETATTLANGFYQFTGYPSGTYAVEVDPSNFLAGGALEDASITYDLSGDLDNGEKFSMGVNDLREDLDFGYRGAATIGDTIFIDEDRDMGPFGTGTDTPVEGVAVHLIDPVTGDTLQSATTDVDGLYEFDFLCKGDYIVDVCMTNFLPGGPLEGTGNVYDPEGAVNNQANVTLGPGESTDEMDFGYNQTPLPIELATFGVTVSGFDVDFDWTTSSETNNAGFEVQMAAGDEAFRQVGFVEGAGNTVEETSYSFIVQDTEPGEWRARLLQLDLDGTESYSETIEFVVDLPSEHVFEPAYPNPFNPTTTLTFGVREQQDVSIKMYDLQGRLVRTLHAGPVGQTGVLQRVSIDARELASGLYFVRMQAHNFSGTQKLLLVK